MRQKSRKYLVLMIVAVYVAGIGLALFLLEHWYSQAQYNQLSHVFQLLVETNPEVEPSLLTALKQVQAGILPDMETREFLSGYGYHSSDFLINGKRYFWIFLMGISVFGAILFLPLYCVIKRQKRMRIQELTSFLEALNVNGIETIVQTKEDEFSLLQDEIQKTVTALHQTKELAVRAKDGYAKNLANIAHQLKTPITAASVSLQLWKEQDASVYVEQMQRQIERLHTLEEALLMLSRIDSGTLTLQPACLDVYTVLSLAADSLNDLLAQKNVTVSIPEHGCVTITGDMDWTIEAVMNLMKNCMEHSPVNGTITCDYSTNPLYTQISIWDEGEGFAREDIPHLFERFYRGKQVSRGGIGIGLSLSKSIFEMQNGTITARNMPEGGACFEIRMYHTAST